MNGIVNEFLLAGDKFMPEIHLRKLGFTYSAWGPFIKNKERMQELKETSDSRYIYQNELDKAYLQHSMAYGNLRICLEKKLLIKFNMIKDLIFLKIQNMKDTNVDLLQWFINLWMGKSSGDAATPAESGTLAACDKSAIKSEIMSNQQLAEELHK